jgi:methionyl-tRNA synthetase
LAFLSNSGQIKLAKDNFANLQFSGACEALLAVATAGNLYCDEQAPWSKFKAGGSSADEAAVVCILNHVSTGQHGRGFYITNFSEVELQC